jgi:hypothetical protein
MSIGTQLAFHNLFWVHNRFAAQACLSNLGLLQVAGMLRETGMK